MTPAEPLALTVLIAPFALLLVTAAAVRQPGRAAGVVLRLAGLAAPAGLLTAAGAALAVAVRGPMAVSIPLGPVPLAVAVRLDALSVALFGLVALLGAVVLRYSRNYLDGDARHGAFMGALAATIAAAMAMVVSGDLAQLTVMWILTSLALHRLLLFYPGRPRAIVAARKKFVVARLGDAALVAAVVLLWDTFGTTDVGHLLERAQAWRGDAVPAGLHWAAGLVVVAAALKSAQFPTHGWLVEVMDTPTPVSALLHAGILNGGAFLVVRLAPVMVLSPGALHAMIVIGALTAAVASVARITQHTVKGALAYSSAAHMGFTMLACGFGVFTLAILHLVAHSCYKAHAFLSAGSAVDVARASRVSGGKAAPGAAVLLAPLLAIATVAGVAWLFGVSVRERPADMALAGILAVGLTQLAGAVVARPVSLRGCLVMVPAAAGTALSFFALELAGARIFANVVPAVTLVDPVTLGLMALVLLCFALIGAGQLLLPACATWPAWARAYLWFRNGFYANACFDRCVGALRVPAPVGPLKETR
ncbi:MAG: proton-conducting transporter membrane subunit [Vicinamibacterales bacterium]